MAADRANIVHALLLSFEGSSFTESTKYLHSRLRDDLGWDVCTYWIDRHDPEAAHSKVENITHTLRARKRHANDKILIYYGGYAVNNNEDFKEWQTGCGITFHELDNNAEGGQCAGCVPRLTPDTLFESLLTVSNDLFFLFHSSLDLTLFQNWIFHSDSLRVMAENGRKRKIRCLLLREAPSRLWRSEGPLCPAVDCESKVMIQNQETRQQYATYALADTLADFAVKDSFTVKDLVCSLQGHPDVTDVEARTILGDDADITFRTTPDARVAAQQGTQAPAKTYGNVQALLLSWEAISAYDIACIDTLREAFEYLNFHVETAEIPMFTDRYGHQAWVDQHLQAFLDAADTTGALAIVYYLGHGAIINDHLQGCRQEHGGPSFNLSNIQSKLRDTCRADVLLLLDCCNSGYLPALTDDPASDTWPQHEHTMETLAACPATSNAAGYDPFSFTKRLAGQLIWLSGQSRSMSVDELNTTMQQDWRYQVTRHPENSPDQQIASGNVRVLNCGGPSIVLQKRHGTGYREQELELEQDEVNREMPFPLEVSDNNADFMNEHDASDDDEYLSDEASSAYDADFESVKS